MIESIPVSTALLQSVTTQLDKVEHIFTDRSPSFNAFYATLHSHDDLFSADSFKSNKDQVVFLQASMLLVLSMVGGVLVPVINSFITEDNRVRIGWDSGTVDTFIFGEIDDEFIRFFSYFRNRLSSKSQYSLDCHPSVLFGMQQFLKNYKEILGAVHKRILLLSKSKQEILLLFNSEVNRDLLFILISSLPTDQVNLFFLHIQQFFPEELEAKTSSGKTLNVISMFQNSSSDIVFLIEKIKIYLDLYFQADMPIIREITRTKTVSYLKELLMNDDIFKDLSKNLFQVDKLHIHLRLKLYSLFIDLFDKLDLKKL